MKRGEETLRYLLAPIQHLLDDPQMVEIVIQREQEVGYERAGEWHWEQVPELTYRRLDAIGILAGGMMAKRFDPGNPICLTYLPDGERFTLCRSPATDADVISASIRVPSRHVTDADFGRDFDDLLDQAETRLDRGPSDADRELVDLHRAKAWREFFSLAVRTRKTIGTTGRMRSGKTTFIRKHLLPKIDPADRLITIEDTPEFGPLSLRNRVSLYYGAAGIGAEDVFEAALRMRADRIAFQELRGKEVMGFIRLQASGHSGSFTTWHADENDPFTPLVLMAKTSAVGQNYPDDKIEKILRGFIDIITFCYHDPLTNRYSVPSVYFRGADQ